MNCFIFSQERLSLKLKLAVWSSELTSTSIWRLWFKYASYNFTLPSQEIEPQIQRLQPSFQNLHLLPNHSCMSKHSQHSWHTENMGDRLTVEIDTKQSYVQNTGLVACTCHGQQLSNPSRTQESSGHLERFVVGPCGGFLQGICGMDWQSGATRCKWWWWWWSVCFLQEQQFLCLLLFSLYV